jgi:hypothetical protein
LASSAQSAKSGTVRVLLGLVMPPEQSRCIAGAYGRGLVQQQQQQQQPAVESPLALSVGVVVAPPPTCESSPHPGKNGLQGSFRNGQRLLLFCFEAGSRPGGAQRAKPGMF